MSKVTTLLVVFAGAPVITTRQIGDCAAETKNPRPATAQVANQVRRQREREREREESPAPKLTRLPQEGKYIAAVLNGGAATAKPFRYAHSGMLA